MDVKKYSKALVAVTAAVVQLGAVTADGDLSLTDGVTVLLALLAALGVYAVPNKTE